MKTADILIIGSGFGGIAAALKLRLAGLTNFLILERRSFMGGTWVQNSYPGAAVDVQSPLYSLESEPHDWSQMFAEQPELEAYTQGIIDKHKLAERTLLNTEVKGCFWQSTSKTWRIESNSGNFQCRFVINATGPLSNPLTPAFKGRDRFKGEQFHSNDWHPQRQHRGKRVAVIGSGASAAQLIPAIVDEVESLHVFQRQPHWVLPRPDRRFKRWQRALLRRPFFYKALRYAIYWQLESRVIGFKYNRFALENLVQRQAKGHLKKQIKDRKLRTKLTPQYTFGCKRVILSNTLYPALGQEHVQLHEREDGIAEITATGIRSANGEHHELDVIVYATGYDATDGMIPYPIVGRDEKTLKQMWADYPRAYLGTALPYFPNLFIVTGPNTGIAHTSAIFIIEAQMNYIVDCIAQVRSKERATVEVRPEAEAEYTDKIHREMRQTVWHYGGCNSWYKSKSGKVIAMFPGFSFSFRRMSKRMRLEHHIIR